ncbi:putative Rio2p serine kinase [Papiliotrema laurentii]|uniref:Serine/threonine-protein kinase RIO2 n=1 Tax=Papiliotrema laurentii TaxID=5418 RepID=A0AAD9CZ79_PAPLA|nr:putative Rio2p serine kinase [Papiliotrema laurentii]
MRLDATDLRYVTPEEFRVLQAVETGSKNHEIVPTPLIAELSGIRSGIITKCLNSLSKRRLVARVAGAKYEGFRLTYGGLDWLSLRTFSKRTPASVAAVGNKIGVGKESDIYVVKGEDGVERVLKLHRLGRISFRAIKEKRDYLGKRKSGSWMFMSRLAAQKEFAFMKVLYEHGFPVPIPVDQARHCIVMSLIDSYPLRAVGQVESPSELYATLMALLLRLAHCGLVHGDYNEFNILIHKKTGEPTIIDFPQMVSTRHVNAEFFFDRDVEGVKRFFRRRFRYEPESWPTWKDVLAGDDEAEDDEEGSEGQASKEEGADVPESEAGAAPTGKGKKRVRLDLEVEASGWKGDMQRQLEEYMEAVGDLPASDNDDSDEEEEEESDYDEGEEEEQGEEDAEGQSKAAEPVDEATSQAQMAAKLEALRLNRALGNDDPSDGIQQNSDVDSVSESSEEETDSEDESDTESIAAQTDYTTYQRAPRPPKARMPAKKLGQVDLVRQAVENEMKQKGGSRSTGAGRNKAGKAKGHKWKSSDKYVVGKDSGW